MTQLILKQKESLINEIFLMLRNSKYQEVIDLIKKSNNSNTYSEELVLYLGKAMACMGLEQQAMESLVSYITFNPKVNLRNVFEELFEPSLYKFSLKLISEQIKKYPLSGYLRSQKSLIHLRMGSLDLSTSSMLEKLKYGLIDDGDLGLLVQIRNSYQQYGEPPLEVSKLLNADAVKSIFERSVYQKTLSLGRDCEFGMVQREMGAEPISLFRWGTLTFESFIRLLENDFVGFASNDSAFLQYENTENFDEFWFHDGNYGAKIHTHFNAKNIDLDDTYESLLEKSKEHFLFLVRKLREELQDGEKLFVYKSGNEMSLADAFQLSKTMTTYGNNKLLIVMPQGYNSAEHEILSESLHLGRLSKFWVDAQKESIQFREWNNIVQKSYNIFYGKP